MLRWLLWTCALAQDSQVLSEELTAVYLQDHQARSGGPAGPSDYAALRGLLLGAENGSVADHWDTTCALKGRCCA